MPHWTFSQLLYVNDFCGYVGRGFLGATNKTLFIPMTDKGDLGFSASHGSVVE